MHIPDGFLDARTCAGTLCIAGAGLAVAMRSVTARSDTRTVPLLGVMSAFIFAGQAVNFPVGFGTSGHLYGGVLAAVLLGPAGAAVSLATVLLVQCFFFQDGGVTALGANFLNLGLIGVVGGYAFYRMLRRLFPSPQGLAFSAALASWLSLQLAAVACSFELAASGVVPLRQVLPQMLAVHALIGVAEAAITAAILSFVLKVRPDLLHRPAAAAAPLEPLRPYLAYGLVLALGVAILASPFASALPDGLEAVAERSGIEGASEAPALAPFPDYSISGFGAGWIGTSLAAGLGTVTACLLAWCVGRSVRRSTRARQK